MRILPGEKTAAWTGGDDGNEVGGLKTLLGRKQIGRGNCLYVGSEGETGAKDHTYSPYSGAGERAVPVLKGGQCRGKTLKTDGVFFEYVKVEEFCKQASTQSN